MVAAATLSGGAGGRAGGRLSTQAAAANPSSAAAASRARRQRAVRSGAPASRCGDPGLGNTGTTTILPYASHRPGVYTQGVDCDDGDGDPGTGGEAGARAMVAIACL